MSLSLNFLRLIGFCLLLLPSLVIAQCNTNNANMSAITDHLKDNKNGIISDPKTGLEWKKCSEGKTFDTFNNNCTGSDSFFSWEEALKRAQTVNEGSVGENLGYSAWRVPNIKELSSIVELSCYSPSINEIVFPATTSTYFWSSSPEATKSNNGAWYVSFEHGQLNWTLKSRYHRVRLVRSGQ